MVTVDTDDIAVPDRFGWWNDMVGHEVIPVSIRSPHANRFRGWVETVRLPHSQVAAFDFSPLAAQRSPAHIRRQDPEDYFLLLVRESGIRAAGIERARPEVRNNRMLPRERTAQPTTAAGAPVGTSEPTVPIAPPRYG